MNPANLFDHDADAPREKTLKAIAYKPGLADSSITEGTYVYESPY
jgi:hypothetical protein